MNQLVTQRRITDLISEYDEKCAAVKQAVAAFEEAGNTLKYAATIAGTWGNTTIDTGRIHENTIYTSLLISAWQAIYNGLNIETIASALDKKRFAHAMEKPPEFTLDNIRATFGNYVANPRENILRGLAEVFSGLDPAFKSHERVKIGVNGLPKRVIIEGFNLWYYSGTDKLRDILNALAALQSKPLCSYEELDALKKCENALLDARGVRLKKFRNGNGHLFFEPDTLLDVNRALAEYYGDVLPDCASEKPTERRASTAVAKDLQYYPTPINVVEAVLENAYIKRGEYVLEPSCGCGRFLDALSKRHAIVFGVEVDLVRVEAARAKGHGVLHANFLELPPSEKYDHVVMNPPFYGKHYAKHVEHALKFLKPGGKLTAILPITARYDHGLLQGDWYDLPVGSFRESGTNINTTVLSIRSKS